MINLTQSLQAWGTDSFKGILKDEICGIPPDQLPLQQGLSYSSVALGDKLSAMILNVDSDDNTIIARAGLFYTGVIAGCNCADDPTPIDEISEYCEVQFSINRQNGETIVSLLDSPF